MAAYQKHFPAGQVHTVGAWDFQDNGDHVIAQDKQGNPQHLVGEDAAYLRQALGGSAHYYGNHPDPSKFASHAENELETVVHETAKQFNENPENEGVQNPYGHPDMEGAGEDFGTEQDEYSVHTESGMVPRDSWTQTDAELDDDASATFKPSSENKQYSPE